MTEARGVLIRVAGSFTVERDGVPCRRGVAGGKTRTLLGLLVAERGRVVTAERIVQALWPARGRPRRPVGNVATLVSRLRGTLGAGVVTGGRHGYRLGGAPDVRVDLDLAAVLAGEAEALLKSGEPRAAEVAAGRALELLHGGAAMDGGEAPAGEPDAEWTAAVRAEAAGLMRRVRHVAAAAGLRSGHPAAARRAAEAAEAAVAADSFDEVAYRLVMRAHMAAGEPAKALLAYERLRSRLAAELGADPATETRALHVAILREEPLPGAAEGSTAEARGRPFLVATGRGAPPAAPSQAAPAATAAEPGPAGRGDEVARISEAWARATAGRTGIVLIAGEPGIGKSRLAAEAERTAGTAGAIVLRARCHEIERALFLQPIVDALRPCLAHLDTSALHDLTGEWAATALESLAKGHFMESRYAFEAVAAFLRALAGKEPVLLVLEDLHAAGTTTVQFVHYLARRMSGVRLLVVATARADAAVVLDALRGVSEVIRLGPLPPEAVRELATAAGQGWRADEVFRRTRGHPELVAALLAGPGAGGLPQAEGVPETVRVAVMARVRALGDDVERLLRTASVLDGAFDPVALGALLDLPPQVAAHLCERALGGGLLVVAGSSYEFANDLTKQAIYAGMPAPTRLAYRHRALLASLV